jgi:hypothetical protein
MRGESCRCGIAGNGEHYRYKPPPRKRKAAPLAGPAVVTPKRKPTEGKKPEPTPAVVRKTQPSRATHTTPADNPKPAIVTSANRKQRVSDDPPLPMELPLSRKPVERDGGDYKRLKAAMARRLRGDDE